MDAPHDTGIGPSSGSGGGAASRWLARVLWGLFGVVALVVAGALLLLRTQTGLELAVETGVERLNQRLEGEVRVGGVRAGSLLGGAVLTRVQLDAAGGHPVLEADSVQALYSLWGLLTGERRLAALTVWGLRARIEPLEDGTLNVTRVAARSAAATLGVPVQLLRIGRLRVHGSRLEVVPTSDGSGGDAALRRITLADIDLEAERLVIRNGGARMVEGRLVDFGTGVVLDGGPFGSLPRLRDVSGELTYGTGGIRLERGTYLLGSSPFSGVLSLGPEGEDGPWALASDLEARRGSLADLTWLDERLPRGGFSGGVDVRVGSSTRVSLRAVTLDLDDGDVTLDGGLTLGERLSLTGLTVELSPLALEHLDPWLERELPWAGWLSGRLTLDGPVASLRAGGSLTLVPAGAGRRPTTARFAGVAHLGEALGVSDLTARLDPLDYRLVSDFVPRLGLGGLGSLDVTLTGDSRRELTFDLEASHQSGSFPDAHVSARGTARRVAGTWRTTARASVDSVNLELFAPLAPDLGLTGVTAGTLTAEGPLDSLLVTGDLVAEGGRLVFETELDVADPAAGYRFYAEGDRLPLSRLASGIPEDIVWTGTFVTAGRGFSLDSLDAVASLVLGSTSVVREVPVDTAEARITVGQGLLRVDTLEAAFAGVRVAGGGTVGLNQGTNRSARFRVDAPSLASLRDLVMGANLVARDTLSDLDRQRFVLEGVDPDTLPTTAEITMSGAGCGVVEVAGSLDSLDLDASFVLTRAVLGLNAVDSVDAVVSARGLPSRDAAFDVVGLATGVRMGERSFAEVSVSGRGVERRGDATVRVTARPGERYAAEGSFELRDGGGSVRVVDASADLDSLVLSLVRPAGVAWDSTSVRVTDLELHRPGPDSMRVFAEGLLSRAASSDFRVEIEGLHLERIARMAQLPAFPGEGHLDLTLSVRGPSAQPTVDADFQVLDPRYGSMALARVGGSLDYREGQTIVRAEAFDARRRVFRAEGEIPLLIDLGSPPRWREAGTVDLRVVSDSLPASVAMAYLTTFDDVIGTVSGDVTLRGTIDDIRPEGRMRIADAAWSVEALGTRQSGVSGTLTLRENATVEVDLTATSPGFSHVGGTVTLDPLSDPALDLQIEFRRFLALSRRDMRATISGLLDLRGRYGSPFVEGALTVNESTIFVDEFVRNVDVVDLNDPRFQELFDPSVFGGPSLVGDLQNPFMSNLRVAVDLEVPQEAWLRSGTAGLSRDEMNVEMGGDLLVAYDRQEGDLVLVGNLEALRGSYRIFGRTFDVEEGTVSFLGTPGINPTLDLTAVTRIRTRQQDALAITAAVGGTLTEPTVTLSSEGQALAETDLVSYLIFGRPASDLGVGTQSGSGGVRTAAVEGFIGWMGVAAANTLASTAASEVSQFVPLFSPDYLAVSQLGDFALQGGVGPEGFLGNTLVEVGQYLGRDIFAVLLFRPAPEDEANPFAGVRIEWAINRDDTFELFWEERFLRSRTFVLSDNLSTKVLGIFLFREWGY